MSQELNPGEQGLSPDVLAFMHWTVERQDGTYSFDPATGKTERFDPATGKKERLVPFPHRRLRREAVPATQASPGRVQVAARSPRRRSIRSSRAKARAPDEGEPPDPSDLRPALLVISRAGFRRELERAGL